MIGLNISEYKALTALDFWCGTDAEIKGLATQSRQSKKTIGISKSYSNSLLVCCVMYIELTNNLGIALSLFACRIIRAFKMQLFTNLIETIK